MENSALIRLVSAFSPVERREVHKFLSSPFFNTRRDVIALFDYLAVADSLDKKAAWQAVFGAAEAENYEDQRFRLLMAYLNGLLEQYVAIKEMTADRAVQQLHLAVGYRKRRLTEGFERARKALEKTLTTQPLRNAGYHELQHRLLWETHQVIYPQNPTDISRLRQLSEATDVLYLAQKLRLVCLLATYREVYQADVEAEWETDIVTRAGQPPFADLPAIAVYLHAYRMLRYPEEVVHFQSFKSLLLGQPEQFSDEEMHGFYLLAVNFCVRRINAGRLDFFHEVLDLYKKGMEKTYLFENGLLSRFTYQNVVAAGLHTGELDWVRYFIGAYKNRLEKRYRESAYSFCLARLEYAEGHHGAVLDLLQKANYRDPLLNLAAKTLLLKTYFDLGELDLLQSHLDAMRNYIHRKRVIGYHRTNYLNIIRYAERFLRLPPGDRAAAETLRAAVEQEEVLTEKLYFQKMLERYPD